mmetsp:Transcript_130551/g.297443  ORF Transcript_130551/g.297443 Transcript_130551/m.297443 type:complete len:231 (-) Transcript_130551:9-701(-)
MKSKATPSATNPHCTIVSWLAQAWACSSHPDARVAKDGPAGPAGVERGAEVPGDAAVGSWASSVICRFLGASDFISPEGSRITSHRPLATSKLASRPNLPLRSAAPCRECNCTAAPGLNPCDSWDPLPEDAGSAWPLLRLLCSIWYRLPNLAANSSKEMLPLLSASIWLSSDEATRSASAGVWVVFSDTYWQASRTPISPRLFLSSRPNSTRNNSTTSGSYISSIPMAGE